MRGLLGLTLLLAGSLLRADDRIRIERHTEEAEAVLRLAELHASGKALSPSDWAGLLETEPYRRLQRREASLNAPLTDEAFEAFVLSPELGERVGALRKALEDWKRADLQEAALRVTAYLPPEAQIHAKVFVVVKPKGNSFVFDLESDPTIFLSLKPGVSEAKFENTVAHEMHHIGLASLGTGAGAAETPGARAALPWVEAFGEGFAMLAAAGSPAIHPHAHSAPADRARWDADLNRFPEDLAAVDRFLRGVANGSLSGEEAQEQGMAFFGEQGPWYTVGYRMAVTIEARFGRAALVDCLRHLATLIPRYNEAADTSVPPLPRFSAELVSALSPPSPPGGSPGPRPSPAPDLRLTPGAFRR